MELRYKKRKEASKKGEDGTDKIVTFAVFRKTEYVFDKMVVELEFGTVKSYAQICLQALAE